MGARIDSSEQRKSVGFVLMYIRRFLSLSTVLVCTFGGLAQSNAESESLQDLIILNIGVTSARGASVTDIRPHDLQIREDGKPRPIIFLRFTGSRDSTQSPAPGEFVNHPLPTPTVLLLDFQDERRMKDLTTLRGIEAALQRMESADRVFIYLLTEHNELFPVQPLPTTESSSGPAHDPSAQELCTKLESAHRELTRLRDKGDRNIVPVVGARLYQFDSLISQMDSLSGRKNLIWVTHGASGMSIVPPTLGADAAESQIAIYTVDQSVRPGTDPLDMNRKALKMLSVSTGGGWYAGNNVENALADAFADARSNYKVAYYSALQNKRKESTIRLDSPRKGIRLRLLSHERAEGQDMQSNADKTEEAAFDDELRSSLDAGEIALRVGVTRDPGTGSVHFNIRVNPADVLIEHRGDHFQAQLGVRLALYSEGSLDQGPAPVRVDVNATQVDVNLTREELIKASRDGILIPQDTVANERIQKIRLTVFDRRLHGIGSITVPAQ
jgi:VWFA-related protein